MENMKGRRVILFPLPFQGHVNPMLQLANILHAKGFSITIIHTHFNSPNPSNYPHFRFCSIPDGLSGNQRIPSDEDEILSLIAVLNLNCVTPFCDCLSKLVFSNEADDHPIACLITDCLWYFTQAVADGLKLPRIPLVACSANFLVLKSMVLRQSYPTMQDSKDILSDERGSLIQFVVAVIQAIKASSGLVLNSCEDLEQEALAKCSQELSVPVFAIGPFYKYFPSSFSSLLPQDQSCISWLDKQEPNSVIYVSFGSIAAVDEAEFLEIAWGLANSKQPFLWVVRPGLVHGSEWLEPLPKGFLDMLGGRGHIVKWAPQQEVLAHPSTGAFWTHCGWNSTLESLCEGVPMICQPCFGDQIENAKYISDVWRVGLHLEHKIDRGEIKKAIRRLMVEAEGKESRDRVKLVKEKINLSLKPGGSSNKSLDNLVTSMLSFK